jgi:serine phosphatase RsbU (regulator of sigma subunit)
MMQFGRRGGVVSAAIGVVLTMITAAALARVALREAAERNRDDVSALLSSSCQASVALGDAALTKETVDELSPPLADLLSVRVVDAAGQELAAWQRRGAAQTAGLRGRASIPGRSPGSVVGTVEVTLSTARMDAAVVRTWSLLGAIALISFGMSALAALVIGREMDEKSRLQGELDAAAQLQTGLLPKQVTIAGLEIATRMLPAAEVGGDYHDLIPAAEGGWLAIGDVVGHGLPAGLVMLMVQSGIGTLVRESPKTSPALVIKAVNQLVFENTEARMGELRYATLTVCRYETDGSVAFAGGHLDPLVVRAATGAVDVLPVPGPFVGLERDIEESAIATTRLQLEPGDTVVLYTDGITEARNATGALFGLERLRATLAGAARLSVEQIADAVFKAARAHAPVFDDDASLVVFRHQGGEAI